MLFLSLLLTLIVVVILLTYHWSQNKGIVYLTGVLLFLGVRQFTLLLINTTEYTWLLALLSNHFDPLFFLSGPFLLYYFKSLVKGKLVADRYLVLHALPAMLVLINLLPYYSYPFAIKMSEMARIQGPLPFLGNVVEPYLLFPLKYQRNGMVLFNLTYGIVAFGTLLRLKRNGSIYIKKKLSVLINRILWAMPAVILPSVAIILYATFQAPEKGELVYRNPAFTSDGAVFLLAMLLPLSFLFIPSWLYGDQNSVGTLGDGFLQFFKRLVSKKAVTEPKEVPQEKPEELERILAYLTQATPYVEVNFSLHDLSQALNIPAIRITNCFKNELATSFPAYRSKLRVAHAVSLLQAGAHLTTSIEGIAERSGFKSKSIFYAAFKTEYDMTPTEWIRKNL